MAALRAIKTTFIEAEVFQPFCSTVRTWTISDLKLERAVSHIKYLLVCRSGKFFLAKFRVISYNGVVRVLSTEWTTRERSEILSLGYSPNYNLTPWNGF
jgi:hypothetical protein